MVSCQTSILSPIKKQKPNFAFHFFFKEGLLQARGTNIFPADSEFATSLPAHTKHK